MKYLVLYNTKKDMDENKLYRRCVLVSPSFSDILYKIKKKHPEEKISRLKFKDFYGLDSKWYYPIKS